MNHAKSDKQSDATKPNKQDYQALERQNRALLKELDLRKREIEFLNSVVYALVSCLPQVC